MTRSAVRSACLAALLSCLNLASAAAPALAASTILVVNLDDPGEGLNDASAISPAGGNPATTLGEARLRATELAAAIWAQVLTSDVPIRVGVRFEPLGGTQTAGTLGRGGAASVFRDFVGAPEPGTWYPSALADRLAGFDLEPTDVDVTLTFNSDTDGPTFLGPARFYYGFDAAPPAGDVDFVSIALHELAHGLGFISYVDLATGEKLLGFDDAYMLHLERHSAAPADFASMTDTQRLAAFTSGSEVHWTGAAAIAVGSSLSAGVDPSGHLEMYAPDPTEALKSLVHFATAVTPDELMEPVYVEPSSHLELTSALLEDVGWGASPTCQQISTP